MTVAAAGEHADARAQPGLLGHQFPDSRTGGRRAVPQGPVFAEQGDFATAGAGNISYATSSIARPRPRRGGYDYGARPVCRLVRSWAEARCSGLEMSTNDGSMDESRTIPQGQRRRPLQPRATRVNGLSRHGHGLPREAGTPRKIAAARDRRGAHRALRTHRPDRRRAHLPLQRGGEWQRAAATDADEGAGVRASATTRP